MENFLKIFHIESALALQTIFSIFVPFFAVSSILLIQHIQIHRFY